jgi:methionine synthase II (cobalamin-independent)
MPAACRGRPICSTRAGRRRQSLRPSGNAVRLRQAVSDIVRKQTELGIDVIDDGEYGKPSFVSYINERLGGYEVDTIAGPRNQWATSREGLSFPEFYAQTHPLRPTPTWSAPARSPTRATPSSSATSTISRPPSKA